ncbi:hypothetical protein SO802_001975 [Lithocarpus litseifolius]|uniref:Fungal lipase-type domain-containing protein n=1 Tax=Lithocarpus litseifolius TaxID=425828 RepID=A0AAW2DWU8_9ROSI
MVNYCHRQMKEEEAKRNDAEDTLKKAEKSLQELKKKLVEEERGRKSAVAALDNAERQAEGQRVLLRRAEDELAASKAQVLALQKKLAESESEEAREEAEKARDRAEQEGYDVGVAKIEEALRAEVSGVCRTYCRQVWLEALNQAGVEASSALRKAESVYYPAAIRPSLPSLPRPDLVPLKAEAGEVKATKTSASFEVGSEVSGQIASGPSMKASDPPIVIQDDPTEKDAGKGLKIVLVSHPLPAPADQAGTGQETSDAAGAQIDPPPPKKKVNPNKNNDPKEAMSSEKQFCENYFVLKPDNASFYDLASFLFSSKSKTSKFIECSKELEGDFWIRWYIFNSLFAQKLLLKIEFLGFNNFWNDYLENAATQAIMFQDTRVCPNLIMVAFRGTEPFDPEGWRIDVDLSWYEFEGVGKTHSGFMKALGLQKNKEWPKEIEQAINQKKYAYYEIRQRLRELLQKNENAKFILTGHSLGTALAILFLTVLAKHEEEWLMHKLEGVYTFGQPRVGDNQLGGYMEKKLKQYDVRYFRFVYCNDIVPRVPYDDETLFFTHFGPCLYYNSFYKGKILKDEPNKNYVSATWAIFKFMNAVWELIRSFIIPYTRGQEYKENWLMKMIRIFGLVFPGLAEHSPLDYVNVTRLGSLPLDPQDSKVN